MKNLSIAFLAAVSLMSFAGCKKKGGGADMMAKMTEFKDQMCKCTDKGCADKVNEAYMKWGQDMAKEAGENKEPPKMSEEDMKKNADVAKAYAECMMKASGANAAMTPPAGDKAAPPAGEKPADPNAATPPAGEKPADPNAATPPPAGEKPAEPAAAPAGEKPAAK
jgi:hypothetical protein